jgi:hypothetical protein
MRRWVRRLLVVAAALLAALCLALALLPRLVSSDWFRGFVVAEAQGLLKRPVRIELLRWSWSEGFDLAGLAVAEDPEFSREPLLALDRVHAQVDLVALARKRLAFDVRVEGLRAQVIRSETSETNVERLTSESHGLGRVLELWFKLLRQVYRAAPVPAEVQGSLRVSGVALHVDDRERKHSLRLHDGSLSLDIPSLLHEPVVFSLSLDQDLDGQALPPIRCNARAERLVREGQLSLADALFDVEGRLPGGEFALKGGLRAEGLAAGLRIDLDSLTDMLTPLLPPSVPDVRGVVELGLHVAGSPKDVSAFETVLGVKGLAARGGALGDRRAGPLDLLFTQKGLLDMPAGVVSVEAADLRFLKRSRVFWRGETSGIDTQRIEAKAVVGPAHLDLGELLSLARPFLPAGVSVDFEAKAGDAKLTLDAADLALVIQDGSGRAVLDDLVLDLPGLAVRAGGGRLAVQRGEFRLGKASLELAGFMPTRASLKAACRVAGLALSGPLEAGLRNLDLTAAVTAENLRPASEALFGVQGGASLALTGGVKDLTALGRLRLADVTVEARAACSLPAGPGANFSLERAELRSPSLRLSGLGSRPIETPLRLAAAAESLRLSGPRPLRLDLSNLRAGLDLGDWLAAELSAGFSNREPGRIEARGATRLDLGRAWPLLAGFLPAKTRLAGRLEAGFGASGRLPSAQDTARLANANATLPERLAGLAFLDSARLTAGLADAEVGLPLGAGGGSLRASRVRTGEPLSLSLENGVARARFSGGLSAGRIEELPGLGAQAEPLALEVAFSGGLEGLRDLTLSERLSLAPFSLRQTLSLSLGGLDRVLSAKELKLAALLAHGQGALGVKAAARLDGARQKGDKGQALAGGFEADAEVRLRGGREVALRAVLDSPGLDLSLGTLVRLVNLQSRIEVSRRFALPAEAGSVAGSAGPVAALLSAEVLKNPVEARVEDAADLARRVLDDVRGRKGGRPSLSFAAAEVKAGPLDLRLTDHELALDLSKPLPSADYFRLGLLGGSVTGSLAFAGSGEAFTLSLRTAFTGIDANRLAPEKGAKLPPAQAEVSGLFSLDLPLSADPERMLSGLSLTADISRIGPRTLERLLFALDPYEADETIVKQRRLVSIGSPRWIRLSVRNGSLSLAGEVEVKGLRIELPRIERVNLANLPVKARLKSALAALDLVVTVLRACSAERIVLSPDGGVGLASSPRVRQ